MGGEGHICSPAPLRTQPNFPCSMRIPQGNCGLCSPPLLPQRGVFTGSFVAGKPLPASALPVGLVKSRVWPGCFCLLPTLGCWCRGQSSVPKPRLCSLPFCAPPISVHSAFGQRIVAHRDWMVTFRILLSLGPVVDHPDRGISALLCLSPRTVLN